MKKRFLWKMLVFLLVFVLMVPVNANAFHSEVMETNLCEHHPAHTQDCGYVEGNESSCTYECLECDNDDSSEETSNETSKEIIDTDEEDDSTKDEEIKEETQEEEKEVSNNKSEALNKLRGLNANTTKEADIPENVKEELAEQGIYPAKKSELGNYWEVYDGPTVDASRIKATVKLPPDVKVPENQLLYIQPVEKDDEYYPTDNVIQQTVGEYNSMVCYKIRWVKIDPSLPDGYTSEVQTILDGNVIATITIDFLKKDFGGTVGYRKLLIYDSKNIDGTELEVAADSLKSATADNSSYNQVTFDTTHRGPYVLISKKVAPGYITGVSMEITDGSEPFDDNGDTQLDENGKLVDGATVDHPGNDRNNHNKVVRSYDTIKYDLTATFATRASTIVQEEANVNFEMILYKSITSARFDLGQMLWIGDTSKIEYFDNHDNLVMVRQKNAKGEYVYYNVNNGAVDTSREVDVNALLEGSNDGKDSYTLHGENRVVKQVLTGNAKIKSNDPKNPNVLAATQSFSAAIQVRNADNGEIFEPQFRLWLEGNEKNYASEYDEATGNIILVKENDNNKVIADKVVTSAGTNFNLSLNKNGDLTYKNWFDFSTGEVVNKETRDDLDKLAKLKNNIGKANPADYVDESGNALSQDLQDEYKNYRYGRISGYGLSLQLYNVAKDNESSSSKGFKGFSLPVGKITFDVNLESTNKNKDEENYTPILWDYNENIPAERVWTQNYVDPGVDNVKTKGDGKGHWGRRLYWNYEERSSYAKGAAPSNYQCYHDGCYNGGNWKLTSHNQNNCNAETITGTGKDVTYSFEVENYDFDFNNQHFPTKMAGNSGDVPNWDSYIANFSAGYIQVLNVFPRYQKYDTVDLETKITANNLKVTTRDGQVLQGNKDDDITLYGHEANIKDNVKADKIDLYSTGDLTKGNSFNKRGAYNVSSDYLGTDYWSTSYDCNAFAGQDISIVSYGMISSNTDYRTRAMNLLQLFDSRALRVDTTDEIKLNQSIIPTDTAGTYKILYAADPDYKEGYDTNKKGVLSYMNTVREEDLMYTVSPPDDDGYVTINGEKMKCIGVLMELRDCDIMGGKYQYLSIPVKVNGEDPELINKTVATVNTFRVWSEQKHMHDITWENGVWNSTIGKNEVDGYTKPDGINEKDESYSGELANHKKNGNDSYLDYVKTEYKNGQQVSGTHANGTLYGNSLLILSYKSHVALGVEQNNYNVDQNESTVKYTIQDISTEIDAAQSLNDGKSKTELSINVTLDVNKPSDRQQRISISSGSYQISGYMLDEKGNPYYLSGSGEKIPYALDDKGCPNGDPVNISISFDSTKPTYLGFKGKDGKLYKIKIYASNSAAGDSVEFKILDAPVGYQLPNITFEARLETADKLKNNDSILTKVTINGSGDCRAYNDHNKNSSNRSIGLIVGSQTNLSKTVDQKVIEVDGTIVYTVSYTNGGNSPFPTFYLNDLMPINEDNRNSQFEGEVRVQSIKAVYKKDNVESSDDIKVYYSNEGFATLWNETQVISTVVRDEKSAQEKADKINNMLNNNIVYHELTDKYYTLKDNQFNINDDMQNNIKGIYIVAENFEAKSTFELTIKVKTKDNNAANLYKNEAYSWLGKPAGTLRSNLVETVAISRDISGTVWFDKNNNGLRDTNEDLLDGVTATLFKKNGDTYTQVTKDIIGKNLNPVTTDSNGQYQFNKLPAGDYIVAFSGDILDDYTNVTSYQSGTNSKISNDGVLTSNVNGISSDTYKYMIKYSNESNSIKLHSIEEIINDRIVLNNYKEQIAHQDLGLVQTGNLEISKTISESGLNNNADENKKFDFKLNLSIDGQPLTGTYAYNVESPSGLLGLSTQSSNHQFTLDENGEAIIQLKHKEKAVILDIPVGTHYEVVEVNAGQGYSSKIDNDTHQTNNTGGNGNILKKDETYYVDFINDYTLKDVVYYNPSVRKVITGASLPTNKEFKFDFELDFDEMNSNSNPKNGAELPNNKTITLTGINGTEGSSAKFGAIQFKKKGTYIFTIREKNDRLPGIIYDTNKWRLIVVVKDTNSVLSLESVTYIQIDKDGNPIVRKDFEDIATFKNTYTLTPTKYNPRVIKKITGQNTPGNKTFTFRLVEDENNQEKASLPDETELKINGAAEKEFDDIKFTKAGTYHFYINEVKESELGYSYDENQWKLTVEVIDNGGSLDKTVLYTKVKKENDEYRPVLDDQQQMITSKNAATFTNNYKPLSTTYAPQVQKVISGGEPVVDAQFEFTMAKAKVDANQKGIEMPNDLKATVSGSGTVQFNEITFTKADTYELDIKEENNQNPLYNYDRNQWKLTIKVEDQNGQLVVTETKYSRDSQISDKEATFENIYNAGKLSISKVVTGDDADKATSKEFKFKVNLTLNNEPLSGEYKYTLVLAGKGEGEEKAITFDKDGYAMLTLKHGESVVINDLPANTNYNVEEINIPTGYSSAITNGESSGVVPQQNMAAVEFTNDYNLEKTGYAPQGHKNVKDELQNETGTFTFELVDVNEDEKGYVLPKDTKVQVDGSGSFSFDTITFTKQGTYKFKMKEVKDDNPYYLYDESIWTIEVNVSIKDDALFVEKVTYYQDGKEVEDIAQATFENTYNGGNLTVSKTVTGNARDRNKEFTFTVRLTPKEGQKLADEYNFVGSAIDGVVSLDKGTMKVNEKGELVFKLKHGQSITILGILDGTSYTVVENDNDQYKVTKEKDEGTIKANENIQVNFTNHLDKKIRTGDTNDIDTWFMAGSVSLLGWLYIVYKIRKTKKDEF